MTQHLYLDQANSRLSLDGRSLKISVPERPVTHVPLHMLQAITLIADIELSSHLLHRLASQGVAVTILAPRSKGMATECINLSHGNHQRRLAQYAIALDDTRRLEWSRLLVCWKLHTQRHQLARFAKRRSALAGRCRNAGSQLRLQQRQTMQAQADALLGIEGSASRLYFQLFRQVLPKSLGFEARNKRPPKDPVNALLSLSYSLLTSECSRALQIAGLDPAFGVYHQVSYGRPSLACDLVELVRTQADHFVWRLLARQELREHHFSQQLGACLLKKEGRAIFFPLYEVRLASCRRHIHRLARRLSREWQNEKETPDA